MPDASHPIEDFPARFSVVKRVYEAIVACSWFPSTDEARSDCYELIRLRFDDGVVELNSLMTVCMEMAKQRYRGRRP